MATRFFRVRSFREGALGVLVATGDLEWMSGGLDAGVFGVPTISPAFTDATLLDEFDVIDRKAQVRRFPIDVKITGADEDAIAVTQGDLLSEIADCNEWGGILRYRPEGMDYPVNLEILDVSLDEGQGAWAHSAEGFRYLKMRLVFTVQPWASTDPMEIEDEFETNTLSTTGGIYNDLGADWTAYIDQDLLTAQQQSMETNPIATTDWANDLNATVARSTAQAAVGSASLSLTAIAAGTMGVKTPEGTAGFTVAPSTNYTFAAKFRAGSTSRTCGGQMRFYDASGSIVGTLGLTPTSDTNTGWTSLSATGTSPASAVYASCHLSLNSAALGEVHYIDDVHVTENAGVSLGDVWVQSNERLVAGNVTSPETRLVHTGSRWQYADPMVRLAFHFGDAAVLGAKMGVVFKWVDASNYLECYVEYTGSNHVLHVAKVVAGVRTVLNTSSSLGVLTGRLLLDVAMQGNRIYAKCSSSGQPEVVRAPQAMTLQRVVTAAVEPLFAAGTRGRVGMVLCPKRRDANVSWFRASDGVVAAGVTIPRNARLSAAIPSAASPVFDLQIGNYGGGLLTAAWFGFGWWDRPRPLNHVSLTSQLGSYGWANSAVTGVQTNAGTALSAGGAPSPTSPGTYSVRTGASAAADAGATYKDSGRLYEAGKTYVLEHDIKLISGSGTIRTKLGVSGDLVTGDLAMTTSWQTNTVEWTPQADRYDVYAAFVTAASATCTFDITNIRVYEKQGDGAKPTLLSGGYLPVGVIPAVATRLNGAGGASSTDASSVHGSVWHRNGAGTCGVTIPVTTHPMEDPEEDVLVDYYVLCKQDNTISSVSFVLSQNDTDDSGGTLVQYSEPYGSTGKPVGTLPSGSTDRRRWYYLGRLAWSKMDAQRDLVLVATVAGTGNFALDTIVGFPASSHVVTPTGVPDANLANELSGAIVSPDLRVQTFSGQSRAARLGGAPLRLKSGMRPECVAVVANAFLPDSTTSSTDSNNATESSRNLVMVPRPRVYLSEAVS